MSPLGAYQRAALRAYMRSFDLEPDDDCDRGEPRTPEEAMQNCGQDHGRVVERLDQGEKVDADHETRLRTVERRGADIAGKLLWLFISAVVCGAVSVVVALLTAGAAG